jgi:hypothetical protein
MIDVFVTVDTEIWCDGWTDLDRTFPDAFRKYVYGPTAAGNYGLPLIFQILRDHGLSASFFVEPMFSLRFGAAPLQEIVGLIRAAGSEIQLHVHTEWVDEAKVKVLPRVHPKRQALSEYSSVEQSELLRVGLRLLDRAGAGKVSAFRAGGFGMGPDTLQAVAANGLPIDTSFDISQGLPVNAVLECLQPTHFGPVVEYPLTVFRDGLGRLRHLQVGACSSGELEKVHWAAMESGWTAIVILFHNFEMLTPSKTAPDRVVARRFERLCRFLGDNNDVFRVRGFNDLYVRCPAGAVSPLAVGLMPTAHRWLQQATRRIAYR